MPRALRDPISPWLDLDYDKRPRLVRRLRRWLPWAVFVGSAIAIAAFTKTSGEGIYQAGPVSSAHAMFSHDCKLCHTQSFQPFMRLWQSDDSIRSVPDEACTKCHSGSLHQSTQRCTPNCASCHREHQGKPQLARVADGHCLSCHGDLKAAHIEGQPKSRSFADFAAHPEFGVWERGFLDFGTMRYNQDPGTIRFNHKKHLTPEGVLTSIEEHWMYEERPRRRLECADCHKLDDAGRYMLPVRFDQHCKECHPLSVRVFGDWKDEVAKEAVQEFQRQPAPHEPPAVVRAALRERYTRFSDLHRTALASPTPRAHPLPGGERKPEITSKEQWEWVHGQLNAMERLLYNQTSAGCQYCHREPVSLGPNGLPEFRKALINERFSLTDPLHTYIDQSSLGPPRNAFTNIHSNTPWLPHSRFRHEAHRMLDCTACHKKTKESTETSDLLLPRISDCKQCHNAKTGVRFDCVTCHSYHNHEQDRRYRGKRTIDECLGMPSASTDGKEASWPSK